MEAAGVVELDRTKQFRQADDPILRIVVAAVRGTRLIASTRSVSVLTLSIAVEASGVVKLYQSEQFGKTNNAIAVLIR